MFHFDDFESENALAAKMSKLQQEVNSHTPIFRENPTTPFDVGDPAYWMEQGSSLIQSAAAFAILGYATGGVAGLLGRGAIALGGAAGKGACVGHHSQHP